MKGDGYTKREITFFSYGTAHNEKQIKVFKFRKFFPLRKKNERLQFLERPIFCKSCYPLQNRDRVFQMHPFTLRGLDQERIQRRFRVSVQSPLTQISFSWRILDKFDKFGILFLILLLNKSFLLPINVCKFPG